MTPSTGSGRRLRHGRDADYSGQAGSTKTDTLDRAALAARSRRFGAWYVTEHRLLAIRSFVWTGLTMAFGTPLLYLLAFGVGLATLVTGNAGPTGVDGVSYLQFVAPALLVMAAVAVTTEEFAFGILLGFKWNPIFVGMNAAPLTGRQIIDGSFLYVGIRAIVTVGIYFGIVVLFGGMSGAWVWVTLPVALLSGFAFSLIAAFSATITEDKGQFAIIQRLIVLPLTLFSGTFFPLTQLPIYLQWIGWLSPIWHGSELARQFSYGPTEPLWLTLVHVGYLAALAIVGWQLCVRISVRRLDK
jgi:lipooligosaccharide transport system permease protein